MASLKDIASNPDMLEDFNSLPRSERTKVITQFDSSFSSLPTKERFNVLNHLEEMTTAGKIRKEDVGVEQPPEMKALKGTVGALSGVATGGLAGAGAKAIGGGLAKAGESLTTAGGEAAEKVYVDALAKRGLKDLEPDLPENTNSLKSIGQWAKEKLSQLEKPPKKLSDPELLKEQAENIPAEAKTGLKEVHKVLSGADDLLKNSVSPNSATGKLVKSVADKARDLQTVLDPELAQAREATRIGYQVVDPRREAMKKALRLAAAGLGVGAATRTGMKLMDVLTPFQGGQ